MYYVTTTDTSTDTENGLTKSHQEDAKMYDMMKKQNFGVEIELTGITRKQAAKVISDYFGTSPRYLGTVYQTHGAEDRKGRT